MTETIEAEAPEVAPKPRRPHRRTKPLPLPEPVAVAVVAAEVELERPEPQLRQPPAYLVSIATTRRDNERRLIQRELERIDKETASRTLRLRLNCAPAAEVERVAEQFAQSRAARAARLAEIEAMTDREAVLFYVPENRGWIG